MAKFEIQLNIPDVKILNIETTKTNDLVITVKSMKKSTKCHARHEARFIMLLEIATLAKCSLQLGTESCAIGGHCKVEQIS